MNIKLKRVGLLINSSFFFTWCLLRSSLHSADLTQMFSGVCFSMEINGDIISVVWNQQFCGATLLLEEMSEGASISGGGEKRSFRYEFIQINYMFQSLYSGSNKVPVSTMGAIIWNKKEHNFTINQP